MSNYELRQEAEADAFADWISGERCEGSGEISVPCDGNHQYGCGGPDCSDDYTTCPGCEDCKDGE